jgi:hypothetical protein
VNAWQLQPIVVNVWPFEIPETAQSSRDVFPAFEFPRRTILLGECRWVSIPGADQRQSLSERLRADWEQRHEKLANLFKRPEISLF